MRRPPALPSRRSPSSLSLKPSLRLPMWKSEDPKQTPLMAVSSTMLPPESLLTEAEETEVAEAATEETEAIEEPTEAAEEVADKDLKEKVAKLLTLRATVTNTTKVKKVTEVAEAPAEATEVARTASSEAEAEASSEVAAEERAEAEAEEEASDPKALREKSPDTSERSLTARRVMSRNPESTITALAGTKATRMRDTPTTESQALAEAEAQLRTATAEVTGARLVRRSPIPEPMRALKRARRTRRSSRTPPRASREKKSSRGKRSSRRKKSRAKLLTNSLLKRKLLHSKRRPERLRKSRRPTLRKVLRRRR